MTKKSLKRLTKKLTRMRHEFPEKRVRFSTFLLTRNVLRKKVDKSTTEEGIYMICLIQRNLINFRVCYILAQGV